MGNQAVEHNVATFSELPLLYIGREGQADDSILSNGASQMTSC